MKKTSLYTIVTVAVIAAGTAFIAHSWMDQDNRGFLGRITGGATDVAAAAVDVPEKLITGEEMSLDQEDRGALGTVVGGTGDVVAATVDVPQNGIERRQDRRAERREDREDRRAGRQDRRTERREGRRGYEDDMATNIDVEDEEEIFPDSSVEVVEEEIEN